MLGSEGAREASVRLRFRGYTGGGYLASVVWMLLLIFGGIGIAFGVWSQDRYDVAHDLYQSGAQAEAHDAQVYHRTCKGCHSRLRAVVEYPDGPRTLSDLPTIIVDTDGLPADRWVTAPPPYDGAFTVYYDRDDPTDPDSIMSLQDVEDQVYQDGPFGTWVGLGVMLTLPLVLTRPAVRSTIDAHRRFHAARHAVDSRLDLLHGSFEDDRELDGLLRTAAEQATDRSRSTVRRERVLDLVMATGVVLLAVSALLWATGGREAAIAYHLRDVGVETKAFDALVTIDTRDGRTVSTKMFAEVRDTKDPTEYHDVEVVVPVRYIEEQLEPGWYTNVEPYRDGFVVLQDTGHPGWVVPLGDLDHLARPGAIVVASAAGLAGLALCVGVLAWPLRRRRTEPGLIFQVDRPVRFPRG
ncbi:hypothetical protein ACFQHV_23880 [Promicromonospora thailandica]|uniref:Uncharacterized protein n=1 Tax=Promicromonospora thailandica TaxID=765201 RepID=A0A9X2G2X8_9MICO|nr:hypothetical protein [Promicromonospora thailandica]MCP2264372.1 hypothetical protein [Promicromonospora thailandica]